MRERFKEWRREWKHARDMRRLGRVDVAESTRYQDRKQNDAMPAQFRFEQAARRFRAAMWITGNREAPRLEGNLWRLERELAAKRRREALSKTRGMRVVN